MRAVAPVITIDGSSATGKGTISEIIAKQLGWKLLESGALYRLLALASNKHHILSDDATGLATLAEHLEIQFIAQENAPTRIILEKDEVAPAHLFNESTGKAASIIAAIPAVRKALLSRQRAFRVPPGLIAEGRDMGTAIFPDAELKFFLTASLSERAKRRLNQLKERGVHATLSALMVELRERDERDEARAASPLKKAHDAILIDTDHLTIVAVVARILNQIKNKFEV